jgi:ATP-dependent Lon protease
VKELATLDEKTLSIFSDRVILKPLTRWNEAYKEFPRYVMEYLVAKYVDPNNPIIGQQRIDKIINEHYVESGARELIKSRIKEEGEYILLGQLQARLDASKDHYWVDVPAIGDNYVRINKKILLEYGDTLLGAGAWGTMTIQYDPQYEIRGRIYPFFIKDFTPFQVTRLNLDDYIEKRAEFSDDDWIDLLVQSIGFDPERFPLREKQLLLLRLVPFVEANYNMIELGPRETGKTYTYRNTSNKCFVISGGKTTPATLFYNQASRKLGILGQKDVVFFDEIASTSFSDPDATTSILKDYMQTGKFSRGNQELSAQASIVLAGNIEVDAEKKSPAGQYEHLFSVLPEGLLDIAFLDRIHCFLPGWELRKIAPENYSIGYGFITDYLAEIFSRFRRRNYQIIVDAHVDFGRMTGRNQDAIKKTTSGFLKLLFPHRTPETIQLSELESCLKLAVECRQRILDQLEIISPGEFTGTDLAKQIKVKESATT